MTPSYGYSIATNGKVKYIFSGCIAESFEISQVNATYDKNL